MKYGKLALTAVTLVAMAILFFVGTRESAVTIRSKELKISGLYGTELKLQDITRVELRETLPAIQRRTNGMDFLGTYKGMFRVEEFGVSRLFVHSKQGPYLVIHTPEEVIVLNYKDAAKTRDTYSSVKAATGK